MAEEDVAKMTADELKEKAKYSAHLLLSVDHSGAHVDEDMFDEARFFVMAHIITNHTALLEDIVNGDA